jgi:glucose-6-phosphate 1-dehydrogenase
MAHTIVIFGASGDLTSRKLIPALYRLFVKKRLPDQTRIVGVARSKFSDEAWRDELEKGAFEHSQGPFDAADWARFAANLFYFQGDATAPDVMSSLAATLTEMEHGARSPRLYYLSTAPKLYIPIIAALGEAGLADDSQAERRIVIEKPFGSDLKSAKQLNEAAHRVFRERQIYRIDHYLGKETVQNMLVLRFANSIFEPIWNRNYIDHVQITVAEEVDVAGRAEYYDSAGVLRDMFQNHLLQLVMITAMEAPVRFEADLVRDEKVKVLRAVRRMAGADFARDTVRGRYEGYAQEEGVAPDSHTATFAAVKLWIENWRWNGVPFYLRSGKAMSCRTTQIVIQFHEPPHTLFPEAAKRKIEANRLVIQVQPAEGIQLHLQSKAPDAGMNLAQTHLDFRFARDFPGELPDAYQRLLLDAMKGDASLFIRGDEAELAWGIIDPIVAAWQGPAASELQEYPKNEWGPACSQEWMREQGREWFDVCPVIR